MNITAYIERDVETGMYVGIVPGIPGAHTQAENLDELQINLKEVVELCLEEMDEESRALILPHHHGRVISRPLLREILREIEITVEEHAELLNS